MSVGYFATLGLMALYGLHRYWILYLYWTYRHKTPPPPPTPSPWPRVTVQLPLYNERYVAERLINAVAGLDYPRELLDIQVLDDSTDDTQELARARVGELVARGFSVRHLHRRHRRGYKAGALAEGMALAQGDFVAIFDADFLPPADFLKATLPHFSDPNLGMVQARWGHLNRDFSLMTRLQSLFLDGHFVLEQTARNRSGAFFNFNGTAGVWRKKAIEDSGGWASDTLTEDLDLSYRAQLAGWTFRYLPDLICPAELPADMNAFRSQQHRWTKGALEVARKLLPAIWRSRLPFFVKLESTVHLTSNIGYVIILALSLLVLPSLWARDALHWPQALGVVELGVFLMTTLSLGLFYGVAMRHVEKESKAFRLKDLPVLMGFGVGMCLNNSHAVLEALWGLPSEFRRTAKYSQLPPRPQGQKLFSFKTPLGWVETLLAVYIAVAIGWSLFHGHWLSVPFLSIFFFGFLYVGCLSMAHRHVRY